MRICSIDASIVETESREVLQDFDVGKAHYQPIVGRTDAIHQAALVAGILDGGNDGKALLPLANHFNEQLGRVLEIGGNASHCVSPSLQKRVHPRTIWPEVARIQNHLDAGILGSHLAQLVHCAVLRSIVDKEMLEAVLRQLRRHRHHPPMYLADIEQLVVAGRDDGDQLGRHGLSEAAGRKCATRARLSRRMGLSQLTQFKTSIMLRDAPATRTC